MKISAGERLAHRLVSVAVLPPLGVGGRQLYRAETRDPMNDGALFHSAG